MSEQFVSVITNEAMCKICYDGGWQLKPFMFFVSQTDILGHFSEEEIFDENGAIRPAIYEYMKDLTTEQMEQDYNQDNVWYSSQFSSISKANETTLTHHLNIPGDIALDTATKEIRTIYFLYQDVYGTRFLYAIARANSTLLFEQGVSQSFFFTFTVTNGETKEMTEFVLNYSCAQDVQDHNTTWGEEIHSNLVARDGSRFLNGMLYYKDITATDFDKITPDQAKLPGFKDGQQLISKAYVDRYIKDYVIPLMNGTLCPPGTMNWWPGTKETVPEGWAIRMGQWLNVDDNPNLYKVIGTRYGYQTSNGKAQFRLMDDRGLFIRGSETDGSGNITNNSLLAGTGFAQVQATAAPNIVGGAGFVNAAYSGAFTRNGSGRITLSTRNGSNWGSYGTFRASNSSSVYKDGVNEVRPTNRNYLPIIRLG